MRYSLYIFKLNAMASQIRDLWIVGSKACNPIEVITKKAPRLAITAHLWGATTGQATTGDRWIPLTKGK